MQISLQARCSWGHLSQRRCLSSASVFAVVVHWGKPEDFTLCELAVTGFCISGLTAPSVHCTLHYLLHWQGRSYTAGMSGMETDPLPPHQHTCVCAVFRWRKGGMVIGWGYCADESESAGLPCIFYALHHSVCVCKICVSIWTIGLQKRGGWKGNRVKSSWICPETNCTLWSAGLLGILVSSDFALVLNLLCFLYFLSHLYCWSGRCSCKHTFGCSVWICMTSVRADIPNLVFIFEGQLNLKGEELKQLN